MAVPKKLTEEIQEAQDLHGIGPVSAEGRLREWSRARWYGSLNAWPPESPIYSILKSPGRATDVQGDGGMGSLVDRSGHRIAIEIRVREVSEAIYGLPKPLRELIEHMFAVAQRERPRSEKACADHFGISRSEVSQRYGVALGWIANALCIPKVWVRETHGKAGY